MTTRDWQREVEANLQEFERREASVFHNPAVARLYLERGVAVGLVVVLTSWATRMPGIDPQAQPYLLAVAVFTAMIAAGFIGLGLAGRLVQRLQHAAAARRRQDDPPAIGW